MMSESSSSTDTFILFTVAGTAYALRSSDVQHMEMVEQVTRVPNAAPFVDGVVFSRGQVVPAVNLRARFGFERAPYDLKTRLIVVQAGSRQVGRIVDKGPEFLEVPAASGQPPQEALGGVSGRYIDGVVSLNDRLLLVVNIE